MKSITEKETLFAWKRSYIIIYKSFEEVVPSCTISRWWGLINNYFQEKMGNFHIFQEHIVLSSDANVTSPKSLILLCHHQILVNYFSSTDENNLRCTSMMVVVHTTKTRYSPNTTGIKSWIWPYINMNMKIGICSSSFYVKPVLWYRPCSSPCLFQSANTRNSSFTWNILWTTESALHNLVIKTIRAYMSCHCNSFLYIENKNYIIILYYTGTVWNNIYLCKYFSYRGL